MADCPNSTPVDERSGGPEMEESIWTSPGPIPGKPTVMEIVCSVGAAVDLCSATPTHGFAGPGSSWSSARGLDQLGQT
jgi:hypothetical protein